YERSHSRKRKSKIDDYYEVIKLLLSDKTPQKFFYKRVLWQYLKDNHGLECSDVTFRAYISRKTEFQAYFDAQKDVLLKKKRFVLRHHQPSKHSWIGKKT